MAFSSRRGRPRVNSSAPDTGTPELRQKRRHFLTVEPIDLCLEKGIITAQQHRSGLHLRWLYTLRYGAPSLTTRYFREDVAATQTTCDQWRSAREQEYLLATRLLATQRCDRAVLRLTIYNELPAFLNPALQRQGWHQPALAQRLEDLRREVHTGLELLVRHWHARDATHKPHPIVND